MLSRINTAWVIPLERPFLAWLVTKLPAAVKPDHLTITGFIGAVLCGISYAASWLSPNFLWLASAGLVINWFGDSLDGTLARYRKIERPRYGFFVDSTLDLLSQLDKQEVSFLKELKNLSPAEAEKLNQLLDKLRG